MSNVLRLITLGGLLWAGFYLVGQARVEYAKDDADGTRIMLLFVGMMVVAVCLGIILVVTYLPRIGDALGNFFFNPNTPIEENPHGEALAAVARGEFRQAIAEYEKVLSRDESDVMAVAEIAHLYSDKLHDPTEGARTIERALDRNWSPGAFTALSTRLADIYWKQLNDASRARAVLSRVAENFPDSRHSRAAQHHLQELERLAPGSR
jgi:tetratricopeptide (TPR) repeat protein